MSFLGAIAGPRRDPIEALLAAPGNAVLAVIAGVEGPSYRPVGAMMTILDAGNGAGDRVGTLSSGCIESDIALHAAESLASGKPRMLRYGRGSPFIDIQLPCGGGLDILLLPRPDRDTLARLNASRAARQRVTLAIAVDTGAMRIAPTGETGRQDNDLIIRFEPDIRFLVFGKGPEASTFARLAQSAGYPNLVLSPDPETLDLVAEGGCATRRLAKPVFPDDLGVDHRTAILLFFHDHDWEPPILAGALETPAFYIGAQGSQRARDTRLTQLAAMGVPGALLAELHGPIGLVPSARDPGTLAVSVMAEVLAKAMTLA